MKGISSSDPGLPELLILRIPLYHSVVKLKALPNELLEEFGLVSSIEGGDRQRSHDPIDRDVEESFGVLDWNGHAAINTPVCQEIGNRLVPYQVAINHVPL
jgi:hypothetical protein